MADQTTIIKLNREQRRANLARFRVKKKKPEIVLPWYLIRAFAAGDVDEVEKALDRAFKAGYEPEYIGKKLGMKESELTNSLEISNNEN